MTGFHSSDPNGTLLFTDGIIIDPETGKFEAWVYNSQIKIVRVAEDTYIFSATGTRHSFWENFTGGIGQKLVLLLDDPDDLEVSSQGQAWDKNPEWLFFPTVEWRVKNALFGGEENKGILAGIRSPIVRDAAQNLLEALKSADASEEHKNTKE